MVRIECQLSMLVLCEFFFTQESVTDDGLHIVRSICIDYMVGTYPHTKIVRPILYGAHLSRVYRRD